MRKWLVLVAAFAGAAGCADLFGFKNLELGEAGPADAAGDGYVCDSASWPKATNNAGTGTPQKYVLAMEHMYFTTTPDGGASHAGFDLDQKCTSSDPSTASCTAANIVADDIDGIDNASVGLLNTVIVNANGAADSLSDPAINANIGEGSFTLLLRIQGLQNDQNETLNQGLTVSLQSSPGIVSGLPKWDGSDVWQVSAADTLDGLDGGSTTPATLISAYVTDGTLVAIAPNPVTLTVVIPSGGSAISGALPIRLSQAILTAKLAKRDDGMYDVPSGTITGRWAIADMVPSIASLSVFGSPLCQAGGTLYDQVLSMICTHTDVTATGIDNGKSPCDAVSVAMTFDAVAAAVATAPSPTPVSKTPCMDAGVCGAGVGSE